MSVVTQRGGRVNVVAAAGRTVVGRARDRNEDALLVGHTLFAVADGMGGHRCGDVASAIAVEVLGDLDGVPAVDEADAEEAMVAAFRRAGRRIGTLAAEGTCRGMGTTLTAARFVGGRIVVTHVGDSRAYLVRGGQPSQITTDHTAVQQLVDAGRISASEASAHPRRNVLTQALGPTPSPAVESSLVTPRPGDVLLLCSDGLTDTLDPAQIARCVHETRDVTVSASRLVELACDRGGRDDVTVVAVRIGPSD